MFLVLLKLNKLVLHRKLNALLRCLSRPRLRWRSSLHRVFQNNETTHLGMVVVGPSQQTKCYTRNRYS